MKITRKQLRKIIKEVLTEAKKRRSKTAKKQIKDLMLDRPFTIGGWPHGEDRGWLPDSKPVNQQISDYFEDMGLIVNEEEEISEKG
ncbi:MAG: hypothetical protein ACXADH_14480 [Candidatus Kariarchaeaceae archaeon]